MIKPAYLGDGVYIKGDGFGGVTLTTGSHLDNDADNIIVLEEEVLAAFLKVITWHPSSQ